MDESIAHVLNYFSQFSYPPTEQEIYTFSPKKQTKAHLKGNLQRLVSQKKISSVLVNGRLRYQLKDEGETLSTTLNKFNKGQLLFNEAENVLDILKILPSIRYLGISGSLSMLYVESRSDIDVFVIVQPHTIWQTRLALLVYKHMLMLVFPHIGKKLCFNLFFAEDGLVIPGKKQTEYVGHELLQLKTIINKQRTYEILLKKNRWILNFFPNVQLDRTELQPNINSTSQQIGGIIGRKCMLKSEKLAKKIQVWWLKRKKLKFEDFGAQLWLIQDDFEKHLK